MQCGNKGDVFAPDYYNGFHCSAHKCRHSCCVGWEICIDENTLSKYSSFPEIMATVHRDEDGACFKMTEDGRCPHLNERGLCDIYLAHGEDLWSDICKNHPRFINRVSETRTEVGLGLSCEEACRLVLENDRPFSLIEIDYPLIDEPSEADFDALTLRDKIISAIEAEGCFDQKISALKKQFDIYEVFTTDEWLERFLELEALNEDWKKRLKKAQAAALRGDIEHAVGWDEYYKRLLTYFVYRHVSIAESEDDLRARLGFAILSAEMIRLLFESEKEQTVDVLIDIARSYSEEIEYSEENTEELIFEFEWGN